jgi:hypothetical protein
MNEPPIFSGLELDRLTTLARFIRSQVALGNRPPAGRIELNNEEATLCAEVIERFLNEWRAERKR